LFKSEPGIWDAMKNSKMFSLNHQRKHIIFILMSVSTSDVRGHIHVIIESENLMTFDSTNSVKENILESCHLKDLEDDGLQ
jgi:hypothetical protein